MHTKRMDMAARFNCVPGLLDIVSALRVRHPAADSIRGWLKETVSRTFRGGDARPSRRLDPSPSPALEPRVILSADVLTYHNNNMRTGANLNETTLTPSNVHASQFGKLKQVSVDGQVYAEPLIKSGVKLPNGTVHNVVYVATEHDSVYAFDADTLALLWHVSLLNPSKNETPIPSSVIGSTDTYPEVGVTSTPVIDPTSNTLFVVSAARVAPSGGAVTYVQKIHALDLTTGQEKDGGPVTIQASVPGTGAGNVNGVVSFDALKENQRSALLLSNGVVYVAWASHGDNPPYHGWIIGYSASNLQRTMVFNVNPDGSDSGIWMSGGGLAADSAGAIYFSTGNGTFDANTGGRDYGDSVVKLTPGPNPQVADYFTPSDQANLSKADRDLGSGGVLLLPTQSGANPNLLLTGGKSGTLYLINRDTGKMGEFNTTNHVVQELSGKFPGVFGTFAYFNQTVYLVGTDGGGANSPLKAFNLTNGMLSTSPASGQFNTVFPGSTPSVSANGAANGIVWTLDNSGYAAKKPAILRAYNAGNIGQEVYDSNQNSSRDAAGPAVKFTVPTVANGKVYVGGAGTLSVYGLLSSPTPTPTGTSAGFVGADTATQGNWPGHYGGDGYDMVDNGSALPSYAAVSLLGTNPYLWNSHTTDPRALQALAGNNRVAAAWYSQTTMTFDVNLTDGKSHLVSLYALDWDGAGSRKEQVDVLDASTGAVLDTRMISSFSAGVYEKWSVTGHVQFRVTGLKSGSNSVVSGLFFG